MLGPSLTDNTKPEGDEEGNNLPSKTEPPVDLLDESMKSGEAVDAELFGRAFAEAMKAGGEIQMSYDMIEELPPQVRKSFTYADAGEWMYFYNMEMQGWMERYLLMNS